MTELPALRASLRETAQRRYGPRGRTRHAPAVLLTAAAAAAGLLITSGHGAGAAREVAAVPTAAPRATVAKADAADPSLRSLLGRGQTLVRAWSVADMKGHVLLSRKAGKWCLSAPDVGSGMTCGSEGRLERDGLKLKLRAGSVEVARIGDVKLRLTARDSAVVLHSRRDRHGAIVFGHRPAGAGYTIYQR